MEEDRPVDDDSWEVLFSVVAGSVLSNEASGFDSILETPRYLMHRYSD
jgi:hypothetical protein